MSSCIHTLIYMYTCTGQLSFSGIYIYICNITVAPANDDSWLRLILFFFLSFSLAFILSLRHWCRLQNHLCAFFPRVEHIVRCFCCCFHSSLVRFLVHEKTSKFGMSVNVVAWRITSIYRYRSKHELSDSDSTISLSIFVFASRSFSLTKQHITD